jgi:glutamate racemase
MADVGKHTILVFDSGVGGLSVYGKIREAIPCANYIYIFDNKGYPYGELDRDTLICRVNEIVNGAIQRHKIDIVVIACNTASTIVLPSLRKTLSIPVVGVVPAIKPASRISIKGIGLIATPATVKRTYTHNLVEKYSPSLPVEFLGTTELVDMAESKLRGDKVDLEALRRILSPLIGKIDVAVLGCTHFPLLKEEISEVLGNDVKLVDSGNAIASRVVSLIDYRKESAPSRSQPLLKVYNSALPDKEDALYITLEGLGFEPIEMIPTQDV